jgi:hypothetical protein
VAIEDVNAMHREAILLRPKNPATALVAAAAVVLALSRSAAGEPSFSREVMAVLSKAGCNMGTCHGNKSGKGGFKLSLRGQDPALDLEALRSELGGRRADRIAPERSLILLKPTGQAPHEGGVRFAPGSLEHRILRDWLAAGCPGDLDAAPALERLEVSPRERVLFEPENEVALEVFAVFAGGSRRDVRELAVYEPTSPLASAGRDGRVRLERPGETTVLVRYLHAQAPVRLALVPARPEFSWKEPPANNFIDEHVFAKLRLLRIQPSEFSSDAEFLRRLYLDTLGILPSAEEARAFAADTRLDKRSRAIDLVLERPEFADFWALKWSDLLRNEEKVLDRKGVHGFQNWIRRSIAAGKPLDVFARAHRDPLTRAESAAQVFLGTRLQCARCHNHPFDRWTQDDYYGWASLFARVEYKILENRRRDTNDQHEFDGEQIVWMPRQGELKDPRSGRPAPPRFLGAEVPELDGDEDRLEQLSRWLSSPDNPLFARVQANRIWYHLMGRGIVEPIDDFRATNPPSHPELLEALAKELIAGGFALRHLARTILRSRAYQLSSGPNETNQDDEAGFSRALVRRLTAEQLLDAQSQVLEAPLELAGYPRGFRAGQLPGVRAAPARDRTLGPGDQFLALFGKPPRLLACECERSGETTLGQAFQLMSGPLINDLLGRPENRLSRLLASGKPSAEIIEELYWAALARAPGAAELRELARHLDESEDRRAALEDVAWSLINSKEFLLRR